MIYEDNAIMPFGKHAGKKMSDVPAWYLLYMYDNHPKSLDIGLRIYISDNRKALEERKETTKS